VVEISGIEPPRADAPGGSADGFELSRGQRFDVLFLSKEKGTAILPFLLVVEIAGSNR